MYYNYNDLVEFDRILCIILFQISPNDIIQEKTFVLNETIVSLEIIHYVAWFSIFQILENLWSKLSMSIRLYLGVIDAEFDRNLFSLLLIVWNCSYSLLYII